MGMVAFGPPHGEEDKSRWRVSIGNGKEMSHIGWVDNLGFYPLSSSPEIVLTWEVLDTIAEHIRNVFSKMGDKP